MQQPIKHPTNAARLALWLALLVAASVAFSLGFACAVPFAAFGAVAALTLDRRAALWLMLGVWFANQLVGFVFLGYPWDADALVWAGVFGGVALLSAALPQLVLRRLDLGARVTGSLAAFLAAFVAYEGGLFLVSALWLGGTGNYAAALVLRVLAINAAAFVGLLAVNRLGMAAGLTAAPSSRLALRRA